MKYIFFILIYILGLVQAKFSVEDYARLYRERRQKYLDAQHEFEKAKEPFLLARNTYITALTQLENRKKKLRTKALVDKKNETENN